MGLAAVQEQLKTPPQSPLSPYEELRNRKLEENKKKLEELNLRHLSAAYKLATTPKTSPGKQLKRKTMHNGPRTPARRSLRLANLPEDNYNEVTADVLEGSRVRRFFKRIDLSDRARRFLKYTDLCNRVYASDEAREYTITEAEKLESELDPVFPSFVRPMLPSHTTGGFWLGLPSQFCNQHLPEHDTSITLVDEKEEEFDTLYLAYKKGLSAGWRGFSIYHELVDGDALVFHLIKPTTFKVYIIRASSYNDS